MNKIEIEKVLRKRKKLIASFKIDLYTLVKTEAMNIYDEWTHLYTKYSKLELELTEKLNNLI